MLLTETVLPEAELVAVVVRLAPGLAVAGTASGPPTSAMPAPAPHGPRGGDAGWLSCHRSGRRGAGDGCGSRVVAGAMRGAGVTTSGAAVPAPRGGQGSPRPPSL